LPEMPGCIHTFDALHANHQTIRHVVIGKRADILVQVKDNTPELRRQLERALVRHQADIQQASTVDKGHGRIETRAIELAPTSPTETGWPHTHAVCRVTRERQLMRRGQTVSASREEALYVASFAATTHTPEQALAFIRGHWSIENCLHHRKDRSMDEDRNRASEHGIGRVMCCIRSITATVLGRAKDSLSVIQRRFARKTHLVLALLASFSIAQWEHARQPYKLA
jgi:predicted transposase YbfD/YdcC